MRRLAVRAILAAAMSILFASGPADGAMYRYTDEKGEIHFVDGADKIPPEYRDHAAAQPVGPGQGSGEVSIVPDDSAEPPSDHGEGIEGGYRPVRKKTCILHFPSKDRREDGKYVVYFGSVANRGTGTARVVKVTLDAFDREKKLMNTSWAYVQPKDIPPSQSSSFEIRIDAGKRDRQTANAYYFGSRFKVSYARCD